MKRDLSPDINGLYTNKSPYKMLESISFEALNIVFLFVGVFLDRATSKERDQHMT